MGDWMDFNGDGEVDSTERFFADEMLCASREEHEPDEEEELEDELMYAGLDRDELEMMDPDEREEALEEAGLDPDDYDFF